MKHYYDEKTNQVLTKPINVQECLTFIKMLGFDYNGYEKPSDLKRLIDELVNYAENGLLFLLDKKLFPEDE